MTNNRIFHSGLAIAPENRVYLERPRIRKLLEDAMRSPLVTISAGAGYGKTQAVYSFLQKYDAITTWVQLSDRDNLPTRFWESFTNVIALYNPDYAARLLEIGFPETEDQFAVYLSLMKEEIAPGRRDIVVFDDFHLLENKAVLQLIRKSVQIPISKVTNILISRTEPDVRTYRLLSQGMIVSIGEDDLRFTEEETAQYFQLLGIPLTARSLADIYSDTAGWAFAINLVGLSLKKVPSQEQKARTAMKLNVFKMIEDEVFLVISEDLQRFLIRLSLIDYLSTDLVSALAGSDALMDEMRKINAFVRYDVYLHAYAIHHLFRDYLRQKQDILTEEEKRATYLKAASWCDENDYKMDAISYYEKAGEYEAIIHIVSGFPLQVPSGQAHFILGIYDNGPADLLERIVRYHLQHTRLLMSIGRYTDAIEECNHRIRKYASLPASDFNNQVLCGAYVALGSTRYQMLPYTDQCDFDTLLEKADYYHQLSPYMAYGSSNSISMNAFASKVGTARSGAMEEYIEALTRAVPYMVNILNGCMYGLDDLARGELLFYQGNLDMAEKLITQASRKAESRNQYEVRNRSLFYLLRIGAAQGSYNRMQQVLKELEAQLEIRKYGFRFITYDIVSSWYYIWLGQTQHTSEWLKGHFAGDSLGSDLANFGNMVKTQYYYVNKRYHELLAFIESDQNLSAILFGRLEMQILKALCQYQTKNRDAALIALNEAYDLALSNNLTMPFIEMGKEMRTLTAAAARDKNCPIPRQWLETIGRRAGAYAQRLSVVVSEYRKANNITEDSRLSSKELDILSDLYHGLSRAQIAAGRGLSLNTVRMVLNNIYVKLGADNVADVIRVALDRNLIK
jgi:LuxR family maltose regulon positive regulatory protein